MFLRLYQPQYIQPKPEHGNDHRRILHSRFDNRSILFTHLEHFAIEKMFSAKSSFESSHTNKKLIKSSLDISQKKNDFKNGLEKEVKILKTLIMFVGMFCVAWLPYAIVSMLAQYGSNIENYINPYTTSLPALFAKTASIFNPIIYILKNTNCSTYYRNKLNCRRSPQILFRKNTPTVQV